jgi:hypothetical protein
MKAKVLFRNYYLRLFKKEIYEKLKIRTKKFENFKNYQLKFSKPFIGRKSLIKGAKNYRAFLLGSDQVWHPNNMGMDFYNLFFVPEEIPKIAYAPSFGISKIPIEQLGKTKKYLNRINYISVREKSGKEIVKQLIHRDVPIVCDPTLLIDRVVWDTLKGNSKIIEEKYIFCYFLGNNILHRDFARQVKQKTGYKIVTLLHMHEYVKNDEVFGDITPFNVGPAEFINLLSNAEIVLTDSFHGSIFSIMYEKIFFTFNRFAEGKLSSTNTRIKSILEFLDLSERRINGNESYDVLCDMTINYVKANEILNEFRNVSRSFLKTCIKQIARN